MNQLVDITNLNIEKKGRTIYQTNEHFRKLANIMEHPEFREFYNLYMGDWDSVKMIVMFMKIYEAVEKHSQVELTPYQKLSIVKDVIDDKNLREKICDGINQWVKNSNQDFLLKNNTS